MIAGQPMIQWVYENVSKASFSDTVYVVTDDQRFFDCVEGFGGKALMTSGKHTCGTDRFSRMC